MATVKFKNISLAHCSIHPDAKRAYVFTSLLQFQLKTQWHHCLSLYEVSPPWVIATPDKQNYHVINQWKPLLPSRRGEGTSIKVLVFPSSNRNISELAWRYAADLFDSSIHRESVLFRLAHYVDIAPAPIQSRFHMVKKSHSLETRCRLFAEESRSPVRTKIGEYLTKKGGDLACR